MSALAAAPSAPVDLVMRGVRVVDPRQGLDDVRDVVVRQGVVAEIAASGAPPAEEGIEELDGSGRHLVPAFVDPHVHLRTPGDEHEEDIESGTRAAAAGGFCAVVAMPNTNPPVDAAPVLRALRDEASRVARVPVGFLAAITRGRGGD
ncbi:MAG TPA: amidohydrolase family protein, partial [Solirubrobacteraceae bacterium]|nr:amidohydrolase family protein [Solirubrobacteraceae bacterium]